MDHSNQIQYFIKQAEKEQKQISDIFMEKNQ